MGLERDRGTQCGQEQGNERRRGLANSPRSGCGSGGSVSVRSGCGLHASPEGARQVLLRGASSETRSRRIENQNTQSGRPQGEGIALLRWWVPPPSAGPAAAQRGPVLRTHWQKQRAGSRRCCRRRFTTAAAFHTCPPPTNPLPSPRAPQQTTAAPPHPAAMAHARTPCLPWLSPPASPVHRRAAARWCGCGAVGVRVTCLSGGSAAGVASGCKFRNA